MAAPSSSGGGGGGGGDCCKSCTDTWRVRRHLVTRCLIAAVALVLLRVLDPQLEDAFGWFAIAVAFLVLSGWCVMRAPCVPAPAFVL
jgi:hypothetical protein